LLLPFTLQPLAAQITGPVISSLSPSAASAGDAAFTLTVNGSGFISGDTVMWNSTPLTTTFVNATQVTATVPANLVATAGSASVTVKDPGGAVSFAVTFTINAAPTITSLNPNSATAGGAAFTLNISGTGFLSGATVMWNSTPLTTSFGDSGHLNGQVAANLIASAASVSVTVQNPGGATSNAVTFTVSATTLTMTSLSPNSASMGGAAFTLTVNGTGFASGATVLWNSTALTTNFVSSTQLTASVTAALIASVANVSVSVQNPGGATSNALPFTVSAQVLTLAITSLSPSSAAAGGAGFTLTVNGSGFVSGAVVQWNGTALTTTFVSATQLTATVSTSLIASPGNASVAVINPNMAASNAVIFSITALSLPQFGFGGGFVMSFYATNSGTQAESFTITFYDDAGRPFVVAFSGLTPNSTLTDTVGANSAKYYEGGSFTAPLQTGSAVVSTSPGVTVLAILRRRGSDGSYYNAGIATVAGYNEFIIPFDATTFAATGEPMFTGFAIANLDATTSANVTCTARDTVGNVIPNAIVVPVLNPLGHFSGYLFTALTGLRGTIDCSSNTKIAAVALEAQGTNSLASFPVTVIR
jgi:hypothetical protein